MQLEVVYFSMKLEVVYLNISSTPNINALDIEHSAKDKITIYTYIYIAPAKWSNYMPFFTKMEKYEIEYSMKKILIPSHHQYKIELILEVEKLIKIIR